MSNQYQHPKKAKVSIGEPPFLFNPNDEGALALLNRAKQIGMGPIESGTLKIKSASKPNCLPRLS